MGGSSVSVTGMCLQIPVNSRLAIVRDALDSSGSLSAQFQCTFLCLQKDTITTLEFWVSRYNYTGNVSGLIIFVTFLS